MQVDSGDRGFSFKSDNECAVGAWTGHNQRCLAVSLTKRDWNGYVAQDMRMDSVWREGLNVSQPSEVTAAEVVNGASQEQLLAILQHVRQRQTSERQCKRAMISLRPMA